MKGPGWTQCHHPRTRSLPAPPYAKSWASPSYSLYFLICKTLILWHLEPGELLEIANHPPASLPSMHTPTNPESTPSTTSFMNGAASPLPSSAQS